MELTNGENEQHEHAYSVAVATTVAAEPAVVAAQAATEVVRVTTVTRFAGKSREEAAVIKIQTAFRGYMVYVIFFYSFCFFPPYLMQAIWFNASEVLTSLPYRSHQLYGYHSNHSSLKFIIDC